MPSPEFQRLIKKLHELPAVFDKEVEARRADIEKAASIFRVADDVICDPVDVNGVPGEWIVPPSAVSGSVLYFLHGGGYCIGSIDSHRHMVANIARAAKVRALMIDYRLSPEHPFPAGLDDAITGYRWLVEQGFGPETMVIAGDSAGGGLALATLLKLREEGLAQPAGAVLISPWTDMTGETESRRTRAAEDPLIDPEHTQFIAELYLDGTDAKHPMTSPLFADLTGLPALFIQVGTAEVLLDDSTRLEEAARKQGVDVELEVWDDMFHVWHFYADWIPEGRQANEKIAQFMAARLPA